MDVVPRYGCRRRLAAPAPVVLGQLECECDRTGQALDVERIAGQRGTQLHGGAGELAECQYADPAPSALRETGDLIALTGCLARSAPSVRGVVWLLGNG